MWCTRIVVLAGCMVLAAGAQEALAQNKAGPGKLGVLGAAIKPAALDAQRGGRKEIVINTMDVDAKLHDIRAIDTVSGSNFITESAFSHSSGLPTAIQNSGSNVIIQNAFILNVDIK